VLADLAAVLDLPALYDDITNDMLAVGAVPYFVEAPDAPAQYLPYGTGAVRVLPDYAHAWPGSALVAAHHARAADGFELGRGDASGTSLQAAVLRDRHRPTACNPSQTRGRGEISTRTNALGPAVQTSRSS